MYHWTVDVWLFGQEQNGCNFKLSVSRGFLETARSIEYSQAVTQQAARRVAEKAGIRISPSHDLLMFGEYGVEKIDHPGGNGCWLELSQHSICPHGAVYDTHNVDLPSQQSLLMAIWSYWANFVQNYVEP